MKAKYLKMIATGSAIALIAFIGIQPAKAAAKGRNRPPYAIGSLRLARAARAAPPVIATAATPSIGLALA